MWAPQSMTGIPGLQVEPAERLLARLEVALAQQGDQLFAGLVSQPPDVGMYASAAPFAVACGSLELISGGLQPVGIAVGEGGALRWRE